MLPGTILSTHAQSCSRAHEHRQLPFSAGLIEAKDVQASITVPDLDVAVVRSVPLIKRFENVDLMLVEMKFQGHGHSAMISMLFDMNTHFWFKGHSKRHAISTVRPGTGDQLKPNAIRSEHTLSYGPKRRRGQMRTTAASSDFVQGG